MNNSGFNWEPEFGGNITDADQAVWDTFVKVSCASLLMSCGELTMLLGTPWCCPFQEQRMGSL